MTYRLLVPTDFSELSAKAADYAASLARSLGAQLEITHVYEEPSGFVGFDSVFSDAMGSDLREVLRTQLMERLHALLARPALQGTNVETRLVSNVPVYRFYEASDPQPETDVIVMGTTGDSSLLHGGLMGTNTERTIRHARVQVLALPPNAQLNLPRRVMLLTDFSDDLPACLPNSLRFVRALGANLLVATVCTPTEFVNTRDAEAAFADLMRHLPGEDLEYRLHNAPELLTGIRELTEHEHVDWVAMVTHGRSDFQMLFSRASLVERLASELDRPILALKADEKGSPAPADELDV